MFSFDSWIDLPIAEIATDPIFNIYFSSSEIVQDDKKYYISNLNMGIELVLSLNKIIQSIHFFNENGNQFTGQLPNGIQFSFSPDKIKSIFGNPYKTGAVLKIFTLDILGSGTNTF